MGDLPASVTPDAGHDEPKNIADVLGPPPVVSSRPTPAIVGHGSIPPPSQLHVQPSGQHPFASQLDSSHPAQPGGSGTYDMANMTNALPQVQYRSGHYPVANQQRYGHPTSPPMMAPMSHMPHYGHTPGINIGHQGYYVQQEPHMSQFYAGNHMAPGQSQSQIPPRQNIAYYPQQMMMNQHQPGFYYQQPPQYGAPNQAMSPATVPRHPHSATGTGHRPTTKLSDGNRFYREVDGNDSELGDKRHGAVRGPPRKPRQSGHAIWIGNLPPQTDLMSLVYHVCTETMGLESLFLISKSNCAFANFKDEKACSEAQQKLHDSKFQAVKLVSRLRKNNISESVGSTTSPTATAPMESSLSAATGPDDVSNVSNLSPSDTSPSVTGASSPTTTTQTSNANVNSPSARDGIAQQDKFFILKSLTVEDLELSVSTGIWATQSHNEEILNNAFKTVDHVYLVFSANKSGEYFGYARMTSQIDEDPAAAIEFAPKVHSTSDLDLPKIITTEATEHAPKGRIIDDSARGTIFWEVYRDDSENESENESEAGSTKDARADAGPETGMDEEGAKTWGKPFKLEWLSVTRLPFYKTRGLRNSWNSNREVKIARDGTELEPSIGRKLIGLFNKPTTQPSFPPFARPQAGGYPPQRPYGQ